MNTSNNDFAKVFAFEGEFKRSCLERLGVEVYLDYKRDGVTATGKPKYRVHVWDAFNVKRGEHLGLELISKRTQRPYRVIKREPYGEQVPAPSRAVSSLGVDDVYED